MAHHTTYVTFLRESLSESLSIVDHCLSNRKSDGGVYGFPAIILSLIVIDTIGSWINNYKGTDPMLVELKNRIAQTKTKKKEENNFIILNTNVYQDQNLPDEVLAQLKSHFRNKLLHQSAIPPNFSLNPDGDTALIYKGKSLRGINLKPLHELNVEAVTWFVNNLEELLSNNSLVDTLSKKSKGIPPLITAGSDIILPYGFLKVQNQNPAISSNRTEWIFEKKED